MGTVIYIDFMQAILAFGDARADSYGWVRVQVADPPDPTTDMYLGREGVIIDAMGDPNSGQLLYGVLFEIGDEFPTAYFFKKQLKPVPPPNRSIE